MVGVNNMGNKTLNITFAELKEGMKIAKDVSHNGRVLLKKGTIVNKDFVQRVQKLLLVGNLEIYAPDDSPKQLTQEEKKLEEFNKIEDDFKEISTKLQKTFINIKNEVGKYIKELREFSQKLQEELKPTSLIIKNIILHGSGTDSIYRHGVNVAALSSLIGKWIGYDEKQLNLLVYSAMLHDFGKTKISRKILVKKEPLTKAESDLIKTHPTEGYKIIKEIPFLDKSVSYGVLMHHEREDGSGYPLGLKGNAIHEFGKIIAIADVFDAINSNRGYKNKKAPFEALQIVKNESLGKLNYEYVKIFLEHIVNYYLGEEVILNTGEKCKILQMNINDLEKPLIFKDGKFIDLDKQKELYIKEIVL